MNKAVKKYLEERAQFMAIHSDLTHFESTEEITLYVIRNALNTMKNELDKTLGGENKYKGWEW